MNDGGLDALGDFTVTRRMLRRARAFEAEERRERLFGIRRVVRPASS